MDRRHSSVTPESAGEGLILREHEPVNLESPFDSMDALLTPTDLFYVRSHFKQPEIDEATHKLEISGAVETSIAFSIDQLRAMPSETWTATLECAGNGRVYLSPAEPGAQWQLGAVSTAEWTGVPLATLLRQAKLKPETVELIFEGADKGTAKEKPVPPTEILYARSLVADMAANVLIAHSMNGEPLTAAHGAPLRAIVPGFYGMASVKWLHRIHAVAEPFHGYFQTSDYAYWDYSLGDPVRKALGPMQLKSSIARPRERETVKSRQAYQVFGAAWTSGRFGEVEAVEVSTDGGETWQTAELLDKTRRGVWRRFHFEWTVPSRPGRYILKSRAIDSNGNVQTREHDKSFGSYVISHSTPVEVMVK